MLSLHGQMYAHVDGTSEEDHQPRSGFGPSLAMCVKISASLVLICGSFLFLVKFVSESRNKSHQLRSAKPGALLEEWSVSTPQPSSFVVRGSVKPMPAIGFGTCCRPTARGPALIRSTGIYLSLGGRLIDTAQMYENHKDLAQAIEDSGVPRDELWITSKVNGFNEKTSEDAFRVVEESLRELRLEYLDLMLIHGGSLMGRTPEQDAALWKGLIKARDMGHVRSIGVSNHRRGEIEYLLKVTGELPAVNQIEYHPWVSDKMKQLRKWCQAQGVVVTAYDSLGGSLNKAQGTAIEALANAHGVSNAQLLLRWALDQSVAVIPGATSGKHIQEDLNLTGFRLSKEDFAALEEMPSPTNFKHWFNWA